MCQCTNVNNVQMFRYTKMPIMQICKPRQTIDHRRFQLRSSDNICSNKKHKANIRCSAPKQRIEIKNKDHFTQIDADNNVADIRR
jgi:hypothetical protein